MVRSAAFALVWVALLASCKPDIETPASLIDAPRILAVRSEPAEVKPGQQVAHVGLAVDQLGRDLADGLAWSYCTARKPLAELGPVNPACLADMGPDLMPLGSGRAVQSTVPIEACRLFGPETPIAKAGQPPGQPVDPDPTGGYYQPIAVEISSVQGPTRALANVRLSCGLIGGTPEQTADFGQRYKPNGNPLPASLTVGRSGQFTDLDMTADPPKATLAKGERVTLRVSWNVCPAMSMCGDGICGEGEDATSCPADCTTPKSCTGAETYVVLDLATHTLIDQREAMHVAWFATSGIFASDRTGREATDQTTSSDNDFTAPNAAGVLRAWVVLRDDRGGVGWLEYAIEVQ
jgi:hypothetical protein